MSVSQILVILMRRAWIVMLALLTTVIVAGGVLLFVPGRYDAVATASIDPGNLDPLSDMGGGLGAIGLIQGNILSLVASQRVAVDVVKRLNLTDNPAVQPITFAQAPLPRRSPVRAMRWALGMIGVAECAFGASALAWGSSATGRVVA